MQPKFWTSTTSMQLRVANDRSALVGNFVVPKLGPHVEFFILRAYAAMLPPQRIPKQPLRLKC